MKLGYSPNNIDTLADTLADVHQTQGWEGVANLVQKMRDHDSKATDSDRLGRVLAILIDPRGNPRHAAIALAFAIGARCLPYRSLHHAASKLGISHQAISKRACRFRTALGLPPGIHGLSRQHREALRLARLRNLKVAANATKVLKGNSNEG
jgi:hypothetical protein